MLNNFILVGRLTSDPTIQELEGKKKCVLNLAINRSFKNSEGFYDTDFIDCILWNTIAERTVEYCRKGDVVGIKGRIQSRTVEIVENKKIKVMELVGEKVSFLSSKKEV